MKETRRQKLYKIVFEADTSTGKLFDILLLIFIGLSIIVVMLESVKGINEQYGHWLRVSEWSITILFTLEYILRMMIVKRKTVYIFSFYGIIDFLSILPTYLSIFIGGVHGLMVVRGLRLLRVFRILKLTRFVNESSLIIAALKASKQKIGVFLYAIMMIILVVGTIMYLVESKSGSGFTSIPRSIYWAIVTLTTVGYGDIAPVTTLGQFIAGFVMIMGYAIIAVPTGIVTAEFSRTMRSTPPTTQVCGHCLHEGHDIDAVYCKYCGKELIK